MIKLEGITKSFGSLQVLKGIDLEINKGEIVSIVGPSGAGSWETFCLSCCYIIECMTIWQTVDC